MITTITIATRTVARLRRGAVIVAITVTINVNIAVNQVSINGSKNNSISNNSNSDSKTTEGALKLSTSVYNSSGTSTRHSSNNQRQQ